MPLTYLLDFDGEGELDSASPPPPTERHRAFSITSDSSGGSCSHRKMPPPEPEVSGGFNNIFGSISSGLGSDRRSVQVQKYVDTDHIYRVSKNPFTICFCKLQAVIISSEHWSEFMICYFVLIKMVEQGLWDKLYLSQWIDIDM